MTNDQLKEMKEVFKTMETILSQHYSAENLFSKGSIFNDVLRKTYKYLGALENAPILQKHGVFNLRDKVINITEEIDAVKHAVCKGMDISEEPNFVSNRFNKVKEILSEINAHFNP